MLVESLVVSSHGVFFIFSLCFRSISKITNILSSMFPTSWCFTVLLFSFFIFFPFHSFKHWRTFNTHVNQPIKLLSPPVLMDSTRFSLFAITEVSRKPKHTHFKYQFQNIHFSCAISPDQVCTIRVLWEHYTIQRACIDKRRFRMGMWTWSSNAFRILLYPK